MALLELIDYDVLRVIWWLLLGVVLIGFAITDGFDLGVAALLPFLPSGDVEHRIAINSVGPVWEGNQVWLLLGGGAIFAAWPTLYAVSFSGFYLAMFAILFALILRPVGFKYRSKIESGVWRKTWDLLLFIGGFVPSLIFGVAIGNVLQGVPFRITDELQVFYDGTFFGLLNPFALACGVLSLLMLVTHGAAWLVLKTEGPVNRRARAIGQVTALFTVIMFVSCGAWLFLWPGGEPIGYEITSFIPDNGPSNPTFKEVARGTVSWFHNYGVYPWMVLAPALGVIGSLATFVLLRKNKEGWSFISSSIAELGIISTVGLSMFPIILPSSEQLNAALTVWDSSSSETTLFNMLIVTLVFVPIVLAYTSWVYYKLWGKVDEDDIRDERTHAY
ncbi:MAG: cytochrome d ubiquinol oxidase subunit II [Methylobacteriaceae bacterium]|nr:cytochrome d ubiquinol oxidase subunit II [Methylobacteriaceae bacterium]